MDREQAIILITGIQASGKSTVAQLLAESLPRSVHVRGDLFRRLIVNGRADMTPDPTPEALRRLHLRHRLTATVCDEYFREGFTVIAQDVILGTHLAEIADDQGGAYGSQVLVRHRHIGGHGLLRLRGHA